MMLTKLQNCLLKTYQTGKNEHISIVHCKIWESGHIDDGNANCHKIWESILAMPTSAISYIRIFPADRLL